MATYTRIALIAFTVLALFSATSSARRRATAATCKLYKIPVDVDAPNHRYSPYSVEVNRCMGQCSQAPPSNCECVAATQKNKTFFVIKGLRGFQPQIIPDHTSCKNRCKSSIKNLCQNGGHQWNENACACTCPTAPIAKPCKANQRWEDGRCECVCKSQSQACPKGMKWNSSFCECQCTMEIYTKCSKLKQMTNPGTCNCEATVVAGHVAAGNKLNGSETKLVAALVVIGFLLGTLFVIDLVLMCSKKGFIYGLFTKCNEKNNPTPIPGQDTTETGSIMVENDIGSQDSERNGHCKHHQPERI